MTLCFIATALHATLDGMRRHHRTWPLEHTLRDCFYNIHSPYFHLINDTLAAITTLATLAVILETVPSLTDYHPYFRVVETIAVAVFTLEYLARIVARRRDVGAYVLSLFGIIDLLAIIPSLFGISNLTWLKTARVLRILRLLRLVRVAHARDAARRHHRKDPDEHETLFRLAIAIYFASLLISITIFGTLIYVAEGGVSEFGSIPLGMVWAAKVTMGGVAQHMPQTAWGDLITIGARFTGLALFGLMLSLIGSSMRSILFGTPTLDGVVQRRRP